MTDKIVTSGKIGPGIYPFSFKSRAGEAAAAPASAATDLVIWFHWGGATGERVPQMERVAPVDADGLAVARFAHAVPAADDRVVGGATVNERVVRGPSVAPVARLAVGIADCVSHIETEAGPSDPRIMIMCREGCRARMCHSPKWGIEVLGGALRPEILVEASDHVMDGWAPSCGHESIPFSHEAP